MGGFSRAPTAPLQRYLRWIQVSLYISSFAFALLGCVTLTVTYNDLSGICPLYATPKKIKFVRSENGTHMFHLEGGINGGDSKTCYYAMYLNVTIAAYSVLWGLLYTFVSSPIRAKKGHLRRTVFPSLLFNSVLFTSELISACVLTLGFQYWCQSILDMLSQDDEAKKVGMTFTCPVIQNMPWSFKEKRITYFRGSRFLGLITISQICTWLVSLTTLILSMICGERFFKMVWYGEVDDSSIEELDTKYQNIKVSSNQQSNKTPSNGMIKENHSAMRESSKSPIHTSGSAIVGSKLKHQVSSIITPTDSGSDDTDAILMHSAPSITLEHHRLPQYSKLSNNVNNCSPGYPSRCYPSSNHLSAPQQQLPNMTCAGGLTSANAHLHASAVGYLAPETRNPAGTPACLTYTPVLHRSLSRHSAVGEATTDWPYSAIDSDNPEEDMELISSV